MDKASDMNETMMQMMSRSTQIKIKLFSGKQKDFPRWTFKQQNNFAIAKMAHVLKDGFMAKMPPSEDQELDPLNNDHKPLINY